MYIFYFFVWQVPHSIGHIFSNRDFIDGSEMDGVRCFKIDVLTFSSFPKVTQQAAIFCQSDDH